jgi:hypothetical protein
MIASRANTKLNTIRNRRPIAFRTIFFGTIAAVEISDESGVADMRVPLSDPMIATNTYCKRC